MDGMTVCGIECPICGETVWVIDKIGEQDFKCDCGFEDTLKIESIK